MMHKEIEVYVDDMIAKSRTARGSFSGFEKVAQAPYQVQIETKP